MDIISDLIPKSKYDIKCPYSMTPECIVIHNTSNDASAKKEIAYMKGNNNSTSYHFAVDDIEARQAIPLDRNAWHAGDGLNGKGNRNGIGIEICYSKSGGDRFMKAEDNSAKLAATLLKKFGWGIDRLKKHQDFSGKYCPHRTLDMGWDRFVTKVEGYMNTELVEINDIVWELSARGIISDKDLWLKKLKEDTNAYWLARKCVNYIKDNC